MKPQRNDSVKHVFSKLKHSLVTCCTDVASTSTSCTEYKIIIDLKIKKLPKPFQSKPGNDKNK